MNGTPVDAASRWLPKLAVKKADAETVLKDVGADPDYVVPDGTKIRVVQAEAWARLLSSVCPHETRYPNLFASMGPDVASAYGGVTADAKLIASLKESKEDEQGAIDKDGASEDDKQTHQKKKRELDELIDKTQGDYRTQLDALLAKLREGAGKAPADVKKQMPSALVALRHAVDDAKLANAVAILRYPLAMPQMPLELKTQAKRILADTVQQRTGHRPDLDDAEIGVTLEDGEVKLSLAGVPSSALRGLEPAALVHDTVDRAEAYVERALSFPEYVAETQDMLDRESDIIKAAAEGFEVDESKTAGGDDLGDLDVAAGAAKGKPASAHRPVPMTACGKPEPTLVAGDDADDGDDDETDGDEGAGGKGGKPKKKAHHAKPHKHKKAAKAKHEKSKVAKARSSKPTTVARRK